MKINFKINKIMGTTPVEWLEKELNAIRLDVDKNVLKFIDISIERAKEMEKQQMIDFANDLLARNNKNYIALPDLAEQYYNETFKK